MLIPCKGFPQALLSTISQKYILSPSSGTIFTSELPSNLSTPMATGGTTTPAAFNTPTPSGMPHGVNPLLVAATHANSGMSDPNSLVAAHHRSGGHAQTPTSVKQLKPPEYFPEWKDQGRSDTGNSNSNATANPPPKAPATPSGSAPSAGAANTSRGGGGANIGMEEAVFLGAQVAAKVVFVVDQGASKGFMSRLEYNEAGPTGIHEYAL